MTLLTRVYEVSGSPRTLSPFRPSRPCRILDEEGRVLKEGKVSSGGKGAGGYVYLPKEFRKGEACLWLKYSDVLFERLKGFPAFVVECEGEKYILLRLPTAVHKKGGLIKAPRNVVEELERRLYPHFIHVERIITPKSERILGFQIYDEVERHEIRCPFCSARLELVLSSFVMAPPIGPERCHNCKAVPFLVDFIENVEDIAWDVFPEAGEIEYSEGVIRYKGQEIRYVPIDDETAVFFAREGLLKRASEFWNRTLGAEKGGGG